MTGSREGQWVAPAIVRAGDDRAGQIGGRVERWPRYSTDFGSGSKEAGVGDESGETHRVLTWTTE